MMVSNNITNGLNYTYWGPYAHTSIVMKQQSYTKHNIFSNFLCFASFFAHLSSILITFNGNETTNYRRHPLNMHLEIATIAEGVS